MSDFKKGDRVRLRPNARWMQQLDLIWRANNEKARDERIVGTVTSTSASLVFVDFGFFQGNYLPRELQPESEKDGDPALFAASASRKLASIQEAKRQSFYLYGEYFMLIDDGANHWHVIGFGTAEDAIGMAKQTDPAYMTKNVRLVKLDEALEFFDLQPTGETP